MTENKEPQQKVEINFISGDWNSWNKEFEEFKKTHTIVKEFHAGQLINIPNPALTTPGQVVTKETPQFVLHPFVNSVIFFIPKVSEKPVKIEDKEIEIQPVGSNWEDEK